MNKFLDKFTFADLFKYAGFGGLAILAAGHLASNKFDSNVKKNEYYSQAVTLLSDHVGAKLTLGEPLTFGHITSSGNRFNRFEKTYVKLCVPVNGSKEDGNYYFWAVKDPKEDDKWVITRAETQIQFLNRVKGESTVLQFNPAKLNIFCVIGG